MIKSIESNSAAATEARPLTSQKLADEVADLMIHKHSPVAAAEDFLKQVAMRSGPQQSAFINSFEDDLNKKYGQAILPTLLIYSEQIGQSGYNSSSEIALANATREPLQHAFEAQSDKDVAAISNHLNGTGFINRHSAYKQELEIMDNMLSVFERSVSKGGGHVDIINPDNVNSIGPNRNAISGDNSGNAANLFPKANDNGDNSANSISRDRNAIDAADNSLYASNDAQSTHSDKFTNVENLLRNNPLVRDWMRHDCGTNKITQADLQGLLNRHKTKFDPARESVYQELAVLNANWNDPEFSEIQSKFPHSSVKYLDMSKVMDAQ